MTWAVTWSGVVAPGTAWVESEDEANVIVEALSSSGYDRIAKWSPAGLCLWASGYDDNATLRRPKHAKVGQRRGSNLVPVPTREEKGCTHPEGEPCFPVKRS